MKKFGIWEVILLGLVAIAALFLAGGEASAGSHEPDHSAPLLEEPDSILGSVSMWVARDGSWCFTDDPKRIPKLYVDREEVSPLPAGFGEDRIMWVQKADDDPQEKPSRLLLKPTSPQSKSQGETEPIAVENIRRRERRSITTTTDTVVTQSGRMVLIIKGSPNNTKPLSRRGSK